MIAELKSFKCILIHNNPAYLEIYKNLLKQEKSLRNTEYNGLCQIDRHPCPAACPM